MTKLLALAPTLLPLFLLACRTTPLHTPHAQAPAPADPNCGWTYDAGAPVRGDPCSRRLALIFTGGAHGEGTPFILDTLQTHDIKAAFFLTGDYLRQPGHADLVRRMLAEGHYVGPHSDAHLLYCAWEDRSRTLVTQADFRADLVANIADLRALGALQPGTPVYFIPPYEWYNADQVAWSRALDVLLFNFTPGSGSNRDWIPEDDRRFVSSAEILQGILAHEQRDPHGLNGFLLLLHLGAQRSDKFHPRLPDLLAALTVRGYEFARLDDLLR